jgi:biopolymer transport protein ExbD
MVIDETGAFALAGKIYPDANVEVLAKVLEGQLGAYGSDAASIRLDVDEAADYRFVIKAMDVCRMAGISDVRLNTRGKS